MILAEARQLYWSGQKKEKKFFILLQKGYQLVILSIMEEKQKLVISLSCPRFQLEQKFLQ